MSLSRSAFDMDYEEQMWRPKAVTNLKESGLSMGFLSDLALKMLYFQGELTGFQMAKQMCLPFQGLVSDVIEFIKREQMCEVKGAGGVGAGSYIFMITSKGSARAREQLERTTYVGPAPVPWKEYVAGIRQQGVKQVKVTPTIMKQALSHLILDEKVFNMIGPAVNSGRSMFLYGPPGNGKTTIAEAIGKAILGSTMYIPYAVEVDGQIIQIYDEIHHEIIPAEEKVAGATGSAGRYDLRWIHIKRPSIMVGGELTLESLELRYDYSNKYYEAPYQMKANGGMFMIDDFGRQQVRPQDLLNRWIVPMEKRVDFLGLHTGRKIQVPFELLLVFSTNLPPQGLVDEAFLRRIRHKVEVTSPSYEHYREIFLHMAKARQVEFDEQGLRYMLQKYYIQPKRPLRASHPRDILDQIIDIATYYGVKPQLSKELIDQAAQSYFVDLDS